MIKIKIHNVQNADIYVLDGNSCHYTYLETFAKNGLFVGCNSHSLTRDPSAEWREEDEECASIDLQGEECKMLAGGDGNLAVKLVQFYT